MQVGYTTLTEKLVRSSIPDPTITADQMLAAARHHAQYLRTVLPRDYQMRVFEDGSVFFRNVNQPGLEETFSVAQIQEKSRDFWRSPHRELWQHVFWMWA